MIRRSSAAAFALAALFAAGCSPRPAFRAPVYPDPVTPIGPISGPSPAREPGPLTTPADTTDVAVSRIRVLDEATTSWLGTPYRRGGASEGGVDCSALARSILGELGVDLPRTTATQRQVGREVDRDQGRPGDLVFFRIGSRVNHVGILLDADRFLHASSSRGVEVARLDERYFARRLVEVRRVLDP